MEKLSIRFLTSYAENGTDYSLLGGYAVEKIDWITDRRTYTNLRSASWWVDIESNHSKIKPGIFFGFTKNLGSKNCIIGDEVDERGVVTERRIYGLQADIDTVFRVSPRVRWNITERFTLGAELEYTHAAYGQIDHMGRVKNTVGVGNTRLLVAMYYFM